MATKGASNHYGNSRGGLQGHKTNHIGYSWAKGFNKKNQIDHFIRHGSQMKTDTLESYVAHAVKFANTIDKKTMLVLLIKEVQHISIIKRQMNSALSQKKDMLLLILNLKKVTAII